MKFASPVWLLVGMIVSILLAVLLKISDNFRNKLLKKIVASRLREGLMPYFSKNKRLARRLLFIIAVACLFIALARPQVGFRWQEVKRRGTDIMIAMDVSRSMLAEDVRPNRLERAKLAVRDLAEKLEGDRVGLIPFAGTAYLMCPPTLDYEIFLQSIDSLSPEMVPIPGTDIASAIRVAREAFFESQNKKKILILVTDGEDLEGSAIQEAKKAAEQGLIIHTAGVGTTNGELIPVRGENGGTEILKDEKGNPVKSRLDEATLKQIAKTTGGNFAMLGNGGEGLLKIYQSSVDASNRDELKSKMERIPLEQFEWPLTVAIILLIAEFLIRDRKMPTKSGIFAKIITIGLFFFLGGQNANAGTAEKFFKHGEYASAVKEFQAEYQKKPQDSVLAYNLGTSYYKSGEYDKSITSLQRALVSNDLKLQNQAYYNLGNSLYREGQKFEKDDYQKTVMLWQNAIKAYEGALKLNKDDKDAEFNRDFVLKRLNKLQQNPPPQSNKNKDKKQDNKQSQPQENQDKKNDSPKDKKNDPNEPQQGNSKPDENKSDSSAKGEPEKENAGKRDGKMSQQEAKDLLNALKNDERAYYVIPPSSNQKMNDDKAVKRNW